MSRASAERLEAAPFTLAVDWWREPPIAADLRPLGGGTAHAKETVVRIGSLLASKYRVEGVIANDGTALIVAAQHVVVGRRVAIKRLHRGRATPEQAAHRFLLEARASARLASDHLCQVSDVDLLPDGTPFLVMEHLEGRSLARLLDAEKRISVGRAVDLIMQALTGLAALHALALVHRRLDPSKLFVTRAPGGGERVKLLDFAGTTSDASHDERADVLAMGKILFGLLAGGGSSQPDEVPPGLAAVVERAIAATASDRYREAAVFRSALVPFASVRSSAVHEPIELCERGERPSWAPKPLWRSSAVVLVAVLALAGGAWLHARGTAPGATVPSPPQPPPSELAQETPPAPPPLRALSQPSVASAPIAVEAPPPAASLRVAQIGRRRRTAPPPPSAAAPAPDHLNLSSRD